MNPHSMIVNLSCKPATAYAPIVYDGTANIDLSSHFPNEQYVSRLLFARSANCASTRVYVDNGVVLELAAKSTDQVETFGFFLECQHPQHDASRRYVKVEFDLIEVEEQSALVYKRGGLIAKILQIPILNVVVGFAHRTIVRYIFERSSWTTARRPFLGAVTAQAINADIANGNVGYNDDMAIASCQAKYDPDGPSPIGECFRLNFPRSTRVGGPFAFEPLDFFRPTLANVTPANDFKPPYSNNSYPFVLEMEIRASGSAGTKAAVAVKLTQSGGTLTRDFAGIAILDTTTSNITSTALEADLSRLAYAGVTINTTKPPATTAPTPNTGPIRVRIKSLQVDYS